MTASAIAPTMLNMFDYVAFGLTVAFSLTIGLICGCPGHGSKFDYLMGNDNLGFIPGTFSLVSSYMSAYFLLDLSHEVYSYGLQVHAVYMGMLISTLFVTFTTVPILYRLKIISVYEYMEIRYHSKAVRILTSVTFIFQMVLLASLALQAPVVLLDPVIPIPGWAIIIILGFICTLYTTVGGLMAVVWTDVFQVLVAIGGLVSVAVLGLLYHTEINTVFQVAQELGRIDVYDFSFDVFARHSFWFLVLYHIQTWGVFYGVTQLQVQKYSAMSSLKKAQGSIFFHLIFLFGLGFLAILCTLIALVVYAHCDPVTSGIIPSSEAIIPYFVLDKLKSIPGIRGVFYSCLFASSLSTLSTGINALAAVTWEDFLKDIFYFRTMSEYKVVLFLRLLVLFFGTLITGCAYTIGLFGVIAKALPTLNALLIGPIGTLFFLGMLCPCVNGKGALIGLFTGHAVVLWISIGGTLLQDDPEPLVMVTEGCASVLRNLTTPDPFLEVHNEAVDILEGLVQPSGVEKIYQVSYLFFPSLGSMVTAIVTLLISLCTGGSNLDEEDRDLIFPCVWNLFAKHRFPQDKRPEARRNTEFVKSPGVETKV